MEIMHQVLAKSKNVNGTASRTKIRALEVLKKQMKRHEESAHNKKEAINIFKNMMHDMNSTRWTY